MKTHIVERKGHRASNARLLEKLRRASARREPTEVDVTERFSTGMCAEHHGYPRRMFQSHCAAGQTPWLKAAEEGKGFISTYML